MAFDANRPSRLLGTDSGLRVSFEFFPPKTEAMEETLWKSIERLALLVVDPDLTYPNGDTCQFVSMCFRCRYVSGEAQVGDEESSEVGWFDCRPLVTHAKRRVTIMMALKSCSCRLRVGMRPEAAQLGGTERQRLPSPQPTSSGVCRHSSKSQGPV